MPLPTLSDRTCGVLLHPTSLPGSHGSGDLGPEARKFVDWLADAGQRWWLMLPLGPCGYGNSPYSAHSAFAGNPMLISLTGLADEGLLTPADLRARKLPVERVDYEATNRFRDRALRKAFERFAKTAANRRRLEEFRAARDWVEDYAIYAAIKREQNLVQWTRWPEPLRDRQPRAMKELRERLAAEIDYQVFLQLEFERQWAELRAYAHQKGVALIGDAPIFVAHDSADVWANRDLFQLDATGEPTVISGVPPDYFSATGQRWGNPLYDWPRLKKTGYRWWVDRLRVLLERVDAVRLDHFIGFERYWEIPASEPTAVNGRWMPGPSADLFTKLGRELGQLPLIAEDLGAVTPEVKALRDRFGMPGIKILQFAFGTDPSAPDFKPHNYTKHSVVFTGTHDNDTVAGWFHDPGGRERSKKQVAKEQEFAKRFLPSDGREIHWDMIRCALASVANTAILPVQDILGLGSEARMNRPGSAEGNWEWRVKKGALDRKVARRLREVCTTYDR